jgi:long-chain acyl-CoA synthetase
MLQTTDIISPKTAKTIAGLFQERVRRTKEACAYQSYSLKHERFDAITWQEMISLAGRWQAAFERDELRPGDRVAIILSNCPEWVLFDLAALGLGLVTVPLFANDSSSNISHILKETGAKMVFVQDRVQWSAIKDTGDRLPEITRVITVNPDNEANGDYGGSMADSAHETDMATLVEWLAEDEREYSDCSGKPDDLATIVYTSGTTGMPKGVMLSHANILENAFACLQRIPVYREDLFLSFLPLSHAFERTVGYYIPMMAGACVAYVRSIERLAEDLREIRPTVLISVPRIYERIHIKIEKGLKNKTALARALYRLTVHTGWQRFLYLQDRLKWKLLFLLWPLLKIIVAKRLTNAFGGRLRLSISGGAPIAPPIARVFIGLGLNFLQGYGLTETSPVVSVNTATCNDPVTIGHPLPGVETLIAPNGELLVRGASVMLGYWQNQEDTNTVIDSTGYFHTGDLVETDDVGRLKIIGRIKEIIVLSTGEKVPPNDLEVAISANPLFEQVMIVGEGRPYLAALVVLNSEEWEILSTDKLPASDQQEMALSDERTERILLSEISRMTDGFPEYAKIRRVHASFARWKIDDGLITSTLKLRRKKLSEQFKTEVDALFSGH